MYWIAAIAAVVGVMADQASKWALLNVMHMRDDPRDIYVSSFFNIVDWHNQGTSFSLFRTEADWGPYAFSIAALAIVVLLVLWLSRITSPILAAALGAVIGGAVGNVLDRLRFGFVVDFLYFHVGNVGWPAFNIADSLIVVGIGVLVFDGMFLNHKTGEMGRRKQP